MCAFQRISGLVVIRRVARLSRISVRLIYGPIRDSLATRRMTTCSEVRWKAHIFFPGENRHAKKMGHFRGHVGFRPEKNVCLPTQLGACSHLPGSRMGPYISCTLIRDSRVIRQGPSGPVGSYRVPTGFRRNPVLARRDPRGVDGSLDCPVSVHD